MSKVLLKEYQNTIITMLSRIKVSEMQREQKKKKTVSKKMIKLRRAMETMEQSSDNLDVRL